MFWEIASFAAPAIKAAIAGWQAKKANDLAKATRPSFEIPQSAYDALENAKKLATMTQLPNQGAIENKLTGSTGRGIEAIKELGTGADKLGAIANLAGNEQDELAKLSQGAATMWQGNQSALRQQQGIQSAWENKANDYNIYQPYKDKMDASGALQNAALNNIVSGVQGAANAATSIANNNWYKDFMTKNPSLFTNNGALQNAAFNAGSLNPNSGGLNAGSSNPNSGGFNQPYIGGFNQPYSDMFGGENPLLQNNNWFQKLKLGGNLFSNLNPIK